MPSERASILEEIIAGSKNLIMRLEPIADRGYGDATWKPSTFERNARQARDALQRLLEELENDLPNENSDRLKF
jgi:hypothetical protein